MRCVRELCTKEFTPHKTNPKQRFCSRSCWYAHKSERRPLVLCERCGVLFVLANVAYRKRGCARFCSRTCSVRRLPIDKHYFDVIDEEAKAYWLGLLFTDGHNTGYSVSLSLHEDDKYLIDNLRTALRSEHTISIVSKQSAIQLSSPELSAALSNLGCHQGKKSHTIRLPNLPNSLIRHFIRGAFDGDGWMAAEARKTKPPYWTWGLYSSSTDFITDIHQQLITVGIAGTLSKKKEGGLTLKVVGRDVFPSLRDYLYEGASVWMERKRILVETAIAQEVPTSCSP